MKRAAVLVLSLLAATAVAAPGRADLEAAATQTAQTLGGVLRDCPASFAAVGFPEKQCVGVGETVEAARVALNAALADDLYGVWRSRDSQRSVYNWLKTAGGYVYLRLQPDPDGHARTLLYLDLPPEPTGEASGRPTTETLSTEMPPPEAAHLGSVTLTPAASNSPAPESSVPPKDPPVQAPPATNPAPAAVVAPVPFGRTLKLQDNRLNGPDVLAVQNRLIALMLPARPGQGDGWYGPVTTQTVRVFQRANGLPVTGMVDRVTWDRLFSAAAQPFDAPTVP